MQTFQWITLVVTVLFGGGGLVAWYKVHKESRVGLSGIEVQDKAATTADWNALAAYWQSEMAALRGDLVTQNQEMSNLRTEVRRLQRERNIDADHIDTLERWIYEGKPPPPPPRRRVPELNDD